MKKFLLLVFAFILLSGCQKKDDVSSLVESVKETVSQQPINPWTISQSVDKISDEKTVTLQADLSDSDIPAVYIETKFLCTNNNFNIVLTSYSKQNNAGIEIKTNLFYSRDGIKSDTVQIPMRSGENKFSESFSKDQYTNQISSQYLRKIYPDDPNAFIIFRTLDKSFLKKITPEGSLLIQVPTELGKPTVEVDFKNDKVKEFFAYCVPKNE